MTISELKKYIFENEKIEYILNEINCHNIKYHPNKNYYSCSNYNGDNPAAINVKNNEYLNVVNWTRTEEFKEGSDIVTLVQYNKSMSFVEALKFLHKILDLPFEFKKQKSKKKKGEEENPLWVFEKHKGNRKIVNVDDIRVLEDKVLNDYVPLLHIDWYKEGIMPWTREKFGLCYSYKYKRIIIPIRHWATGELIATNARTVVENYEEFNIKKYILTSGYNKQSNLYGLWENYNAIQKAGYVVIYESEKSVLKRDSLGDSTGVALSGHTLSDEQVLILSGLNVNIIIALDNDISIDEVRHMCSKFYGVRNVSYILDKWNLMPDKSSPADCSNKVFNFLMKHKVKYDEHEHNLYLKSLNKNTK